MSYSSNPSSGSSFGRFAITCDGNDPDPDDIGAITMSEALIWAAGAQGSLVHLDHSNHQGTNVQWQYDAMVQSAERAISRYGIPANIVFDMQFQLDAGTDNLAAQINASSANDRLRILQAGPWETMIQAFEKADPNKHQYVDIISHNGWNDAHEHPTGTRNKNDFQFLYGLAGPWNGITQPTYITIKDGNTNAFKTTPISSWNWLLSGGVETRFVFYRTVASQVEGDFSDATMTFWHLTGNANASMQDIRNLFGL